MILNDINDFCRAAANGDVTLLKILYNRGVSINSISGHISVRGNDLDGWPALKIAIYFGQVRAVEFLIKNGADPNRKDYNGNTALHESAFVGSLFTMDTLLEAGASVDIRNDEGDSPMDIARKNHNMLALDRLIEYSIYTPSRDKAPSKMDSFGSYSEDDTSFDDTYDYKPSYSIPSYHASSYSSKPYTYDSSLSKTSYDSKPQTKYSSCKVSKGSSAVSPSDKVMKELTHIGFQMDSLHKTLDADDEEKLVRSYLYDDPIDTKNSFSKTGYKPYSSSDASRYISDSPTAILTERDMLLDLSREVRSLHAKMDRIMTHLGLDSQDAAEDTNEQEKESDKENNDDYRDYYESDDRGDDEADDDSIEMPHKEGVHFACRNKLYPVSKVKRFKVPDDKVSFSVNWPEYNPTKFTDDKVTGGSSGNKPVWADKNLTDMKPEERPQFAYNEYDQQNKVNRKSFEGKYEVVDGIPLNPHGRTGMTGRGLLGRFGPNHAADPVVTRWKTNDDGTLVEIDDKQVLQFVAIKRRDTGDWAFPGGMVEPGSDIRKTLLNEFTEEALDKLNLSDKKKKSLMKHIDKIFKDGQEIYSGYVDDPRNTDNAWMETCAVLFHDEEGKAFDQLPLKAGDDACAVDWTDVHCGIQLYASHRQILQQVVEMTNCHW